MRLQLVAWKYGEEADCYELLRRLLTLDWSCRCSAQDALRNVFFDGAEQFRGAREAEGSVLVVGESSPPPFVPEPWYAQWSVEYTAWFFFRTDHEDSCTWEKPCCVSYPWEVYWCRSECSFFFQNVETGVAVWSLPSD